MLVRVTYADRNYQHTQESYHLLVKADRADVRASFFFPHHAGGVWECATVIVGKKTARWLGQQLMAFADATPDVESAAVEVEREWNIKELPADSLE